jgi:ketosteroid isomerase-like protein
MSLSHAKEIAWSHWRCLNDGDIEASLEPLNDAGTWWNISRRTPTPMRDFKDTIRGALGVIPIRFTLHSAIEEDDRVLLELESHASLPGGATYNNVYCFVCTLWGDSVLHVREYFDNKTLDVLLAALAEERAKLGSA